MNIYLKTLSKKCSPYQSYQKSNTYHLLQQIQNH